MAVYNKIIVIQKLNSDLETWEDFYLTEKAEKDKNPAIHARVNKASGKEYFNARVDITNNTFNFYIRWCKKLQDIIFDTASYRVIYLNRIFDIKNVDNYMLNNNELTIVGESVGEYQN